MNLQSLRADADGTYVADADRHRVLRNTYALLSLSMLPTILGAWIGVASGLFRGMSGLVGGLLLMVVSVGLLMAVTKKRNSAAAVPLLLAFTFVMGLTMSNLLGAVLGLRGGAGLVMTAFAGTAGVFFGMAALATVVKRDVSFLGKFLLVGLVMLLVGGLANLFLHSGALAITLAVISVGVFSAFMFHDLKRVRDGLETNYVMATLAVYLDLINVFQSLLILLSATGRDD